MHSLVSEAGEDELAWVWGSGDRVVLIVVSAGLAGVFRGDVSSLTPTSITAVPYGRAAAHFSTIFAQNPTNRHKRFGDGFLAI